jgi:glycoprotein 6-alpha-L-fucosyltransferase
MQGLHPDASSRFKSLDDVYYFGGQHGHDQVALQSHKARSMEELDMLPGDKIGIAGNHWDGYSKGKNHRTGKIGLYPSFKVAEDIRTAVFPKYPEADNPHRTRS